MHTHARTHTHTHTHTGTFIFLIKRVELNSEADPHNYASYTNDLAHQPLLNVPVVSVNYQEMLFYSTGIYCVSFVLSTKIKSRISECAIAIVYGEDKQYFS